MKSNNEVIKSKNFFKLFKNGNQFEMHQTKDKESMLVDETVDYGSSTIDVFSDITLNQLITVVISGFQRWERGISQSWS